MDSINIRLLCFFLLFVPVLTGSLYAQTGTETGTTGTGVGTGTTGTDTTGIGTGTGTGIGTGTTGTGTTGTGTSGGTTTSGTTTTSGSTTTGEKKPDLTSKIFDMSDMPVWARDLRRAEIVAFGSFPFTMFAAQFFMDLYRFSDHDWDTKYAPWPAKGAGAINMTNEEYEKTILYAALASLSIMTIDFSIVQLRRLINSQKTVKGNGDSIRVKKKPVSP